MSIAESTSASALKAWLVEHGGEFHPNARFCEDASGSRIVAADDLPENSTIVSCPFALVITQTLAKRVVLEILGESAAINADQWSERQWISTYLALHWIVGPADTRLAHTEYLNTLPTPEKLRTPLHFTPSELDLFKGTNLYGAALDRRRDWENEWNQCRAVVMQANSGWGDLFTWEKYLTAATYLSSRAFPSSILSLTPSLIHSPSTQPVLLPGVDALNHARGQPVSWLVTHPSGNEIDAASQESKISLVLHSSATKGQELFNNYGPKPNSELILGYGFSIPHNPDDTIVLKIGGIQGRKWEIGRDAQDADILWNVILSKFLESSEQTPTYEDILDASGMLQEMVVSLISKLPQDQVPETAQARPDVVTMFQHYLEGQKDILRSLMDFARAREQDAVEMAKSEGIDVVLEEH